MKKKTLFRSANASAKNPSVYEKHDFLKRYTIKIVMFFSLILFLIPSKGFTQTINIEDTFIQPRMMSSSDGTGGTTSTYFHLYKNQVEKINKKFNLHETYTILGKKSVGKNTYYTLKGNNRGTIVYLTFKASETKSHAVVYSLIFELPGEFKEEYYAF